MAASFSHQLLYGSSECSSSIHWVKRHATTLIDDIRNLGLDPSRTLVMKRLQLPATDALKKVVDSILPDVCCDVLVKDDTGFIHFNHFENCHECDPRDDLVSGLPLEAHFLWQYGERRQLWTVEGVNAEFTKPRNPYAVSWH